MAVGTVFTTASRTIAEADLVTFVTSAGFFEPLFLDARAAIDAGVSFDPGSMFRPDRAAHPLAIRLCFSAAPTTSFEEGARRLARAWRAFV